MDNLCTTSTDVERAVPGIKTKKSGIPGPEKDNPRCLWAIYSAWSELPSRNRHQTARDYLTTTSNSEISIDLRQAYEHLFKKTVTTLLDPRLRLRLTQD
jgi:hypothetical protein